LCKTISGEISDEDIRSLETVNVRDEENQYTPLHWASHFGQLKTAERLIDFGANVNLTATNYISPLHLAAAGGHHEIVRLLIMKGAHVNHLDVYGNTALHYAAFSNFPHSTNEILTSSLADLLLTNGDNKTAYHLAIENKAHLAQAVIENYLMTMIT